MIDKLLGLVAFSLMALNAAPAATAATAAPAASALPAYTQWLANPTFAAAFCGNRELDGLPAGYSQHLDSALLAAQSKGIDAAQAIQVMGVRAKCASTSGRETTADLLPGVKAVGEI